MSDVGKGGTFMLEAIGVIICIIIAVICAKKKGDIGGYEPWMD